MTVKKNSDKETFEIDNRLQNRIPLKLCQQMSDNVNDWCSGVYLYICLSICLWINALYDFFFIYMPIL